MPKLKLISADMERIVDNIEIRISGGCPGISLVNNGHDDLYDLGFRVDGLRQHGLKIIPVEDGDELDTRHVSLVSMSHPRLVEAGEVPALQPAAEGNALGR